MKRSLFTFTGLWTYLLLFIGIQAVLSGCDQVVQEDVIPAGAGKFSLNPDYRTIAFNQKLSIKDVLQNDTIALAGSFQLSKPLYGFVEPNSYHFVPRANFVGIDSLAYTVCIGDDCKSSYVLITVKDSLPSGAPCTLQANRDWVTTLRDSVLRYPVYINDEVCERFKVELPSQPVFGSAYVDEQMRVVYEPAPGFIGSDSVWYELRQGIISSAGGWLQIHVIPRANNLPAYCTSQYARADTLIAPVSTDTTRQFVIRVLDNDIICNNLCSNLKVEVISRDGPGEAVVTLDGRAIQYTAPNVGNSLTRLRYRVCASCSTQPVCLESQVYIRNE